MYRENGAPETRQTFDRIAPGWYGFRHRSIFTPELQELAGRWQQGRLLNVGCAHGPDFLPFGTGFELTGIDYSRQMLAQGRKYSRKFGFTANFVLADALTLPFSENEFDWAIAVAIYHHISGKESRLSAFKELRRVLKPGAEAFITVWNRRQPRFWWHGHETNVPWKSGENELPRYYYLYTYGELSETVRQAGFSIIRSYAESTYWFPLKMFSRNICLLVRK